MQDQHFMQQWNTGHDRFSEDFDRLARKLLKAIGSSLRADSENRGVNNEEPDDGGKRRAAQECPLAHRARLTGIGIVAGILAGASLAMFTPLVTALDRPPYADHVYVGPALA